MSQELKGKVAWITGGGSAASSSRIPMYWALTSPSACRRPARAIARSGKLALVANRAENSVSVLSIEGKDVKVVDTVALAAPGAPTWTT